LRNPDGYASKGFFDVRPIGVLVTVGNAKSPIFVASLDGVSTGGSGTAFTPVSSIPNQSAALAKAGIYLVPAYKPN
jgi:hypothetical protein